MIYFNKLKSKKKKKKKKVVLFIFFFKYCINDAGENCKSSERFSVLLFSDGK